MDSNHVALCTLQTRVELYLQSEALMHRRRGQGIASGSQPSAMHSPADAAAEAVDARAKMAVLRAGARFAADRDGVEQVIALVKETDD